MSFSEQVAKIDVDALQAFNAKVLEEFGAGYTPPVGEDRTCLSWWYPKIEGLVPTPRTEIVRAGISLTDLIDGKEPKGFDEFCGRLAEAGSRIQAHNPTGYLFLRTGHTSGKHNWDYCCRVGLGDSYQSHVASLVEFSAMAGFFGLPTEVWAVREMLPVNLAFRCQDYGNMPVVPERRYFIDGGKLLYSIPYWPEDALRQGSPDDTNWRDKLPVVQQEFSESAADMARKCGEACGGKWSVDVLLTRDGYYVTDMAEAEKSWGWVEQ
jgi:hypothetical protein